MSSSEIELSKSIALLSFYCGFYPPFSFNLKYIENYEIEVLKCILNLKRDITYLVY